MRAWRIFRLKFDFRFVILATCLLFVIGVLAGGKGSARLLEGSPTPTPFPQATCSSGNLGPGNAGTDLIVKGGTCTVKTGTYMYRTINIYGGGALVFDDGNGTATDLWAANIIIENKGTLRAGSMAGDGTVTPFVGPLTIHLWGSNQGPMGVGATCASDLRCGVPDPLWSSNSTMESFPKTCSQNTFSNGVSDCFYRYDSMTFDNGKPINGQQQFGYFGYKVLGVGYGGTLQLYGKKGATYDNKTGVVPSDTGTSWARLNNCPNSKTDAPSFCNKGTLSAGAKTIVLAKKVDWQVGDNVVVSPTDYLPDHGEQVRILSTSNCSGGLCDTFTFKQTDVSIPDDAASCPGGVNIKPINCKFQFPHMASQYSLSKVTGGQKPTGWTDVDTRAAVGLLTRSIRIVSGGDGPMSDFPLEPTTLSSLPGYYFGGHMVIREGFQKVQMQGVELYQMGQGGKVGHYPIHFHMARAVPNKTNAKNCTNCETWVKDCSIWDSMTRWIAVHATQGLLLARNVGYKSIGHGFYMEDGTETDNKLYANLGVFARAAIVNNQNKRLVPGILAAPDYPIICEKPGVNCHPALPSDDVVPYHSDWDHPTTFWIMNGWNDFQYNMAAGTGTCGVCYWLLPAINSGMSRKMKWTSYASEQQLPDSKTSGGTTPLEVFTGNTCVSSMASFLTIGNQTACNGVQIGPNQLNPNYPVLNPAAVPTGSADFNLQPSAQSSTTPDKNGLSADNYYPHIGGGGRFPTKCTQDNCDQQKVCANGNEQNCVVTTIDHYTTSFNWVETNFAAVWLRPLWYLFINSAITDVQNGGITMVTGGGYTKADVITGHWALAKKSIFIGHTQYNGNTKDLASNPAADGFALDAGPFNPQTGLTCDQKSGFGAPGNYCLDAADGVAFPLSNFAVNQRLFSIYDGPAYEDSNAYLDITRSSLANSDVDGCTRPDPNTWPFDNHTCPNSKFSLQGKTLGIPYDPNKTECYLPNAAIAWKQPNGFFYPPAFHSRNLLFDNVDIRHFVIEPLFDPSKGLYVTDGKAVKSHYCNYNSVMFTGYTDIDRQTELNDDDGTLTGLLGPTATTGLVGTISVNQDQFFQAPERTPECLSDVDVNPSNNNDSPTHPGTAVTSPYDYVSTVVFPACAANLDTNQCGTFTSGKDSFDNWNADCATPNCYGVPMYRENLLTGETAAVPIRMAGQSKSQRSTLTTNNNRYYIDTTPSDDAQVAAFTKQGINHFNVFRKGQIYYVFLLFAKNTTKQTYDLYVGKNFNAADTEQLYLTQADLPGQYSFSNLGAIPNAANNVKYDSSTGVLSVTLDMSLIKVAGKTFNELVAAAQKKSCQPTTFCKWVDSPGAGKDNCQCADSIFSPPSSTFQANECSDTNGICSWATKDVDCPDGGDGGDGGCFGFGVKMAEGFAASDSPPNPPPTTQAFVQSTNSSCSTAADCASGLLCISSKCVSPWDAPFSGISDTSDKCYYSSLPPVNFSK